MRALCLLLWSGLGPPAFWAGCTSGRSVPGDGAAGPDIGILDRALPGNDGGAPCPSRGDWTVGLLACKAGASAGYSLFAPLADTAAYLIDHQGRLVHRWPGKWQPGFACYLLEDGTLLRALSDPSLTFETDGGRIQKVDWDGAVLWDYRHATATEQQHHSMAPMPNGNVLLIAHEYISSADAIAAGRDPTKIFGGAVWPDKLVEVRPTGKTTGEVVWQWRAWDHLVQEQDSAKKNYGKVSDHPELLNVNFMLSETADWTHFNSIAYNQELDQILVSAYGLGEVLVIDHGTTTAQAASHAGGKHGRGGDILYRWGNPEAYGAGLVSDRKLHAQHDATWIASHLPGAGDILVFNNMGGAAVGQIYSTVDEFTPPVLGDGTYPLAPGSSFAPYGLTWRYMSQPPEKLVSLAGSGAQRLPGGNTFITVGDSGVLFEVTASGEVLWKYVNPVTASGRLTQGTPPKGQNNWVFKATRYPASYPGLQGRPLRSQGYLELPAL